MSVCDIISLDVDAEMTRHDQNVIKSQTVVGIIISPDESLPSSATTHVSENGSISSKSPRSPISKQARSPVKRSPLHSLIMAGTPNSARTKNSTSPYDITMDSASISKRYIVSLNHDNDSNSDHDDFLKDEEDMNGGSIVANSVCSGYAGSISAMGSEWSGQSGCNFDSPERIRRNLVVRLDEIDGNKLNTEVDADVRTEASVNTSFSTMLRKSREKRRQQKLEIQKTRNASILEEFRAFLGWTNKGPSKEEEKQSIDVPVGGETKSLGDEEVGDEAGGENDRNDQLAVYPSSAYRQFDTQGSLNLTQEYSPHRIHGDIPWIVFDKSNDENMSVSTINNASLYMEQLPQSQLEYKYDLGQVPQVETEKASKMEFVYIFLVAVSITTLTGVIVFLSVYF
jgi:hypothetical protein